jgi:PAS domain S-box-containing protein
MGHSAAGPEKKPFLSELFGKPESLPILLFILFFAILFGAGPELRSAKYVFEPPWLLFTLNSVFITGLCLLIAGLCFRSFLRGGFLNVLLLGCGVLTFGLSSFAAGWLIRSPYGPNFTVTTHNIGVLFTAVLYFLSSLFTAFGFSMEIERRRGMIAAAACSAVFLLGAVLTAETVRQVLPPFYLVGEGPTVIRQIVLSVSVTFLLTSALLMMTVYAERKTGFLLYAINALLLIGTGIVGVALAVPGSPLSWLGRAAQYLGDVYLAVASMKALGEARSRGTTVERALANFFRRSETHYRALIEMAADAIVAVDREGKIILMNPAAGEIFGYGRGEAVGKNLEELIVPEQSRDPFHACLSGQSHREIEMELVRKDGSIFPAELSFSPEMKFDGGSEKTIIIRDVTDRRRAEEALRESETRFRTLAGATFEGVAITEHGRIADVNEQFCKISGFDRSELLGMDVRKLVHPDDRDRILDNIVTGRESAVEHRMIRKDGSLITVEAHGKTVRHDGRDRRLTAVRDITEARKAEDTIRSVALFPLQNPEPVMRIHRDGTLLFSNPAAGPVLAEWQTAHEDQLPDWVRQPVEAALNEGTPRNFETHIAGRDFSFVVTPIVEGQYANLYGWDVTDRRRAEVALRESEERLRLAAQAAGFGTYDGDPATGWAYWSPELKALFGLSPEEPNPVLPDEPSSLIHPEDRDRVYRATRASFDPLGSGLLDEEHRIWHASGEWRWAQVIGKTLFRGDEDNHRPERATGIVLDITKRKRAEVALRENEERYRGLFESMNEGFALHELIYDENGEPCDYRFLDVNPAFERQTGLKRKDVVGKTVLEAMPGTEPLWIKRYGEVALTGTPAHFESHASHLGRDYEVFAYRPAPGQFAVIFMDITDRRRAEESLRASYDLLKIAQRAANAGLWAWDIPTGKLTWSEEFYNLFGLDPATSTSFDAWLGILHPDDRQPAMERITRSVKDGTPLENEYRIIRPDGEERWIRAWGNTFYDESAQPLSMSGICIDATESKRAEEALRASELRMKAVADHFPVGVWFADETGKIVYGNEAGRRIWAGAHYVDPEEFHVYKAWWAETGVPLGPEDWAVSRAVRKGETSLNEVLEIECFDSTRKTILNSAVPLQSSDGSLQGVVVLNEDITERIEAEQALRRSEARYRSYIEVTGQIGWATNADGEVVDDLPAWRQYTGQTFDEIRGWGWTTTLHPDDVEITRAVWRKAIEDKQGYEAEYRLRRHDGVYRHFLARGLPVLQDDSSMLEWVGTCIDITERKEAEAALRQNEARFRLLSDTAGRLLATDDPQGLIELLCRDVMEHLRCQAFFNFMVDERAGRLRLNACAGIPEEEVQKLEWLDYGVAVCGCVARDNVRIIAEDIFHTPDARTDLVRSYGIQAYCCHPLRAQDRLIGTLSFGTKTRARFTPEEVDLMRTVADQVAVAMQRIRAQQEIRKSEEALRLVNEELEQRVRERTTELILLLEDLEKSRDDLRRLASELVLTEERERKKISVALHDEVAQTLAAARMRIDLLRSMPGGDEARRALDEAQQLLVQAIRETRSLMTDISNPVLYDMGLQVAVQSLAEDVKARNGISFASSFSGSLKALGQDMEVMIFQVVKELVQNIVKHSGARKASIRIVEERDDIRVVVADDGLGFDAGNVGKVGLDGGFGLFSIRERVKSYNGRIKIESVPGKGSEVTVMLPKKAAGGAASRKTRKRKEQV